MSVRGRSVRDSKYNMTILVPGHCQPRGLHLHPARVQRRLPLATEWLRSAAVCSPHRHPELHLVRRLWGQQTQVLPYQHEVSCWYTSERGEFTWRLSIFMFIKAIHTLMIRSIHGFSVLLRHEHWTHGTASRRRADKLSSFMNLLEEQLVGSQAAGSGQYQFDQVLTGSSKTPQLSHWAIDSSDPHKVSGQCSLWQW